MTVAASGPTSARIMIVGEAPGEREASLGEPFVGQSGQELNRMLAEAGIMRSECFLTNVCRERPPGNNIDLWLSPNKRCPEPSWIQVKGKWVHPHVAAGMKLLEKEISLVRPNVVIAFGNTALWALTEKWGIKSWRGSLLSATLTSASLAREDSSFHSFDTHTVKVIPAYHPDYVLRDWSTRQITVQDLKRAAAQQHSAEFPRTEYDFIVRPDFKTVKDILEDEYLSPLSQAESTTISCDIETRAGHIACLGLSLNSRRAICIPFMCTERTEGYWSFEEEVAVVSLLRRILCHPAARVIGQNFIYDTQYIYRHWGFIPRFARDTMLGHHVCFAGTPKGLDYLSSMYCENHVYWKDEGKTWDAKTGEDQLWTYNCKDCVITFECDERIQETVDTLGLREQHDFQQSLFWPVLEAMVRGVRVAQQRREAFSTELSLEIRAREAWFTAVLGHPLNPRSPPQMKHLFYDDLKQPPILSRATKKRAATITLDDEALTKIGRREPMLLPLCRRIAEHRTLGVFRSTFVNARLDTDSRLRCSYNISGAETFRFSSSTNAFDSGLNLQNIPKGGGDEGELQLPNVRKLFIPDEACTFFDADLDRADLQVVVAEAEDEELADAMARGVDMHLYNMRDVFGIDIPDDEILESHPRCAEHKERYYAKRHQIKEGVHATNYGCQARTLAATIKVSIAEAERFRLRWFAKHPGILRWHKRVEGELSRTKAVKNRWGYRRMYFDRLDSVFPEALAWIPQSTVAITINKTWKIIYDTLPDVQVLLQVHDSLAGQFPTANALTHRDSILAAGRKVLIPYPRSLCIPLGIKTSTSSWGDCR